MLEIKVYRSLFPIAISLLDRACEQTPISYVYANTSFALLVACHGETSSAVLATCWVIADTTQAGNAFTRL